MRQKNHTARAYYVLPGLLAIIMVAFIITSCQKTSIKEPLAKDESSAKDEMQVATDLLEGQLIWGKLENSGSEDNLVYLNVDNGNKAVFVQLAPENQHIQIPSLEKAIIITSQHGIIIKNPLNNQVLLFPQNDTESMRKFESIASLFKEEAGITPIAGTIFLNFNS